jgi:hypothetical protein
MNLAAVSAAATMLLMVDGAGDGGRVYRLSDYLTSKSRQLRDISHMGIVHLIANISGVGQTSRFHVTISRRGGVPSTIKQRSRRRSIHPK